MKKNKIIVPALGLIALSTAASITGTVAWFTANNSVSITGMTFSTKVGTNLFVGDAYSFSESKLPDTSFSDELDQSVAARLEPVSTVNGLDFFYTTDAKADGSKTDDAVFATYSEAKTPAEGAATNSAPDAANSHKSYYDAAFNAAYDVASPTSSTVLYGYVDYVFYLKATYTSTTSYLIMDDCNLLYNGAAITEKAWRVALFVQNATSYNTAGVQGVNELSTALTGSDRKTILTPSGAANFTANQAVSGQTTGTPSYGAVTYNTAAVLDSASDAVKYYKVTVRLWLEGEDKTCNVDTFKALTSSYTLDLSFAVESANTNAVSNILTVAPAP